MSEVIKLSSPATRQFWEVAVIYEDSHLLALNKPAGILTSPGAVDLQKPSLIQLLHRDINRGAGWAASRQLTYLMNVHRLDAETTGVLLLAKSKPAFTAISDLFGSERPARLYVAFVAGTPPEDEFEVDAKIAPDPVILEKMRVHARLGKKARTQFHVRTRFNNCTLVECRPATDRLQQVRVHLAHARFPILGDSTYGGQPLLLSDLKPNYRLKAGRAERPLISGVALHLEEVSFTHPLTGDPLLVRAEWPKDLVVAMKYLRRYSMPGAAHHSFRGE